MPTFVLQIDTSTAVCSVALSRDGETIALHRAETSNAHASSLTLMIGALMNEQQMSYSKLSAVAVSKGPGSYTGLRIGVSTAKGICYAHDLPLIAIDSLLMLAEGFRHTMQVIENPDAWLCPMIDARRMEVYQAIYTTDLQTISPTVAAIIDEHSFEHLPQGQNIYLFGSGADKFEDVFRSNQQVRVVCGIEASASALSSLSYKAYVNNDYVDTAYFEPFYLKDFIPTSPKKKA